MINPQNIEYAIGTEVIFTVGADLYVGLVSDVDTAAAGDHLYTVQLAEGGQTQVRHSRIRQQHPKLAAEAARLENIETRHKHYYKDVSGLDTVDVYRVLSLFEVADPCLQHAIKKLLVAGGRGAGKDISQDVREAIDSLERWEDMQREGSPDGN